MAEQQGIQKLIFLFWCMGGRRTSEDTDVLRSLTLSLMLLVYIVDGFTCLFVCF